MKPEEFLNLSKKSGQNKAEAHNFIFRLIRIDQEDFLSYPEDVRADRVCVEIDNGKITKAVFQ